jgi:hypothetical protein
MLGTKVERERNINKKLLIILLWMTVFGGIRNKA